MSALYLIKHAHNNLTDHITYMFLAFSKSISELELSYEVRLRTVRRAHKILNLNFWQISLGAEYGCSRHQVDFVLHNVDCMALFKITDEICRIAQHLTFLVKNFKSSFNGNPGEGVSFWKSQFSNLEILRPPGTPHGMIGLWCQKLISWAGISNYIPQNSVGCNYLAMS